MNWQEMIKKFQGEKKVKMNEVDALRIQNTFLEGERAGLIPKLEAVKQQLREEMGKRIPQPPQQTQWVTPETWTTGTGTPTTTAGGYFSSSALGGTPA